MGHGWCAVTNSFQFDGFGSQYSALIASVAFAHCHNLTFCYSPIRTMDHNEGRRSEYLREVQELMNVGGPGGYPVGGASHLHSSTQKVYTAAGAEPVIFSGPLGTAKSPYARIR